MPPPASLLLRADNSLGTYPRLTQKWHLRTNHTRDMRCSTSWQWYFLKVQELLGWGSSADWSFTAEHFICAILKTPLKTMALLHQRVDLFILPRAAVEIQITIHWKECKLPQGKFLDFSSWERKIPGTFQWKSAWCYLKASLLLHCWVTKYNLTYSQLLNNARSFLNTLDSR